MIIEKICKLTGRDREFLVSFGRSAGIRYKCYDVPKRTGGERRIEQPSRAVKALQRLVSKMVFSKYPIHDCAMGYILGKSILDNAKRHNGYRYSLRIDIKDFFWSFTNTSIKLFLSSRRGVLDLNDDDLDFIVNICTRGGRLTMGAPSSPIITNIVMFDIDSAIHDECKKFEVTYTRYADDFFFSCNKSGKLQKLLPKIEHIFSNNNTVDLKINEKKTTFLSRKYKRSVTGMVIKPDGGISIGRDRKRFIKSGIHNIINNKADEQTKGRISGMLAWISDVEPDFYQSLCKKYGREQIESLMKGVQL